MAEIASAYLSILPSMKGFATKLTGESEGETSAAGNFLGLALGKSMLAGFAVAGVAVGIGKALYSIGSEFDDNVEKPIRVSTGATGEALIGLEDIAKKVGESVPVSFSKVGPVIAALNQRLDLTGKPLQRLSEQFLELGHITGQDIDINTVTGALSAFSVKAGQSHKVIDQLFQVTQSTGISFSTLASTLQSNGAALSGFGLSMKQAAVLAGSLDKAGLDSNRTFASLRTAMANFAKAGKDPQKALKDTIGEIDAFVKKGDQAGAVNVAAKIFGTRGATQFVAAVKSGRLSVDQLTKANTGSSDTIEKAAKDTEHFSEQWQLFKNRVLVVLEPVATRVFRAVGNGATQLNQALGPALRNLSHEVETGNGDLGHFANYVQSLGPVIRKSLPPVLEGLRKAFNQVKQAISENRPQLIQIGNAIKKLAPILGKLAGGDLRALGIEFRIIIGVIGLCVRQFNALKGAGTAVGKAILATISFYQRFSAGVQQKFNAVVSYAKAIPGRIRSAVGNLGRTLYSAGEAIITGLISGITAKIGALTSKLHSLGNLIKAHKGPPAADKVMLYPAGQLIMDGLISGITSKEAALGNALDKVGKHIKKKLQDQAAHIRDALSTARDDFASLADPISSNFTQGLFDFTSATAFTNNLFWTKQKLQALITSFSKLKGEGLSPGFLYQLFQSGGPELISGLASLSASDAQAAGSLFSQVTDLSTQLGTAVAGATDKGAGLETQTAVLSAKLDKIEKAIKDGSKDVKDGVNGAATSGHRRGKNHGGRRAA